MDEYQHDSGPSIKIKKSIRFQKFRQEGENRPGIRNQKNPFMTVQINNMQGRTVKLVIICVDAITDKAIQIHPNGLVGKDCQKGIYKNSFQINSSQQNFYIEIPYLHIERKKTRKSNIEENNNILMERAALLPSPWKERFIKQCYETLWANKSDKTKVRLAVIATVSDLPDKSLIDISEIIKNGGQNTSIEILKLSNTDVPASTGAFIDIFTKESSSRIEPGKYKLYVSYTPSGTRHKLENWESDEIWPNESSVLYGKVISYKVPCFEPNIYLTTTVDAILHLECPESNLQCTFPFCYVPSGGGLDVIGQDSFSALTDTDLDASPSSKKFRLMTNEDDAGDAITASLIQESVKMKPNNYQGDVSGQVTQYGEMQQSQETKQSTGTTSHDTSQYVQTTGMTFVHNSTYKLEDVCTDTPNNDNWLESTVAWNSQNEYHKVDNSPAKSGIFLEQDSSVKFSAFQDVFPDQQVTVFPVQHPTIFPDQQVTVFPDKHGAVFNLKRKVPGKTTFLHAAPTYPNFVSAANISPHIQIHHFNAELHGMQNVKTEQLNNALFCDGNKNKAERDQNTFPVNYQHVDDFLNNFSTVEVDQALKVLVGTESSTANESDNLLNNLFLELVNWENAEKFLGQ